MGTKETFEKMTTAQFLLMQLRRRRGKEIEEQFHATREQARVLALLKMADAQEVDAMAAVLGVGADELSELVVSLEAQGLVEVAGNAPAAAAPAEDVAQPVEAGEAVEAAEEAEDAEEPAEAGEPEAAPAPAAPATVRITEAGRTWVQPPTDLPALLLADFDEAELDSFADGLDKLIKTLESTCGATAAQLMEEERKRREEAAARNDRGPRDGRGDKGGRDFDRKGRKFDKDRKFDRDRRGGGKFDRDRRDGDRKFGGDRRGGFNRDRDDRGGNRGGYGDKRGGYNGRGRDDRRDDRRNYGDR